jgi:hypothetical protein
MVSQTSFRMGGQHSQEVKHFPEGSMRGNIVAILVRLKVAHRQLGFPLCFLSASIHTPSRNPSIPILVAYIPHWREEAWQQVSVYHICRVRAMKLR